MNSGVGLQPGEDATYDTDEVVAIIVGVGILRVTGGVATSCCTIGGSEVCVVGCDVDCDIVGVNHNGIGTGIWCCLCCNSDVVAADRGDIVYDDTLGSRIYLGL